MDLSAIFAPLTGWLDAHPSVVAWLVAWFAALAAAQTIKQVLPAEWSVTSAKRATQVTAMLVGAMVSFCLWPEPGVHAVVYAIVVGMSAPTAYTMLKALIEWCFPELAYKLSWERVQERKAEPDDRPPDCHR